MKKVSLFLAVFICSLTSLTAVPKLTGRVVDNADIIDSRTELILTEKLAELEKNTGIQLAVLTIKSLNGQSIEEFSIEVAEAWALGQKEKDNGILLTVALDDHRMRIEVGYGLNPVLTASRTGAIIREYMTPYFRNEEYGQGIQNACDAIIGYVCKDEDIVAAVDEAAEKEESGSSVIIPFLMFLFFIITVVTNEAGVGPFGLNFFAAVLTGRKFVRRRPSGKRRYHHNRTGFYSDSSDWNSGSGGDSGFSGGGGSFGGGGSSGSW